MNEKQVKLPGPDHPISVEPNRARVVVSIAGRVIADTRNALTLREASYPPVQYIPGEDIDSCRLERIGSRHVPRYEGNCVCPQRSRWRQKSVNAVWSRGSVSYCCPDKETCCVLSRASR